jgi:peptidoglycan-associated lipoprotein
MQRRSFAIGIAILALFFGAVGCATDGADTDMDSNANTGGTGTDFDDGSGGLGGTSGVLGTNIGELETVYFDYDQSSIRSDAAATLRANATVINNNPDWGQIMVQGNTDERGSEEYNLALGERRAMAVKSYLVDLGVDRNRLGIVSFGEATPAVPGHDESAYQYNRRSEFAAR